MRVNAMLVVFAGALGACALFPSLAGLTGACELSAPLDLDGGLPSWRIAGSAELRGDYADLTKPIETQAGLLAWTTPVDLTTTTLTFDLSLTDDGTSPGMGAAIGLLGGSAAAIPCVPDYDLCFLGGVAGVAVIVRTAQRDALTPQAPFVAVVDTSVAPTTPPTDGTYASLPGTFVSTLSNVDDTVPPPDASWHSVTIAVANGKIDVTIDGVTYLSAVALPAPAPTSGVWAFGASTDKVGLGLLAHERASIRNPKVVGPPCPQK